MRIKPLKKQVEINERLAELIGIIFGDGNLTIYKSEKRSSYAVAIAGNKTEDLDYFIFIKNLIKNIFDEDSKIFLKKDCICLQFHSKQIVGIINALGVPIGNKSHILMVPDWIKVSLDFVKAFIRGLADTDFCVTFKKGGRRRNSYPVITGYFSNFKFASEINFYLKNMGIKGNLYREINNYFDTNSVQYRLDINGKNNLSNWQSHIGFSNPKHQTKILVWQKYGYLSPNTTIEQRKNLLKAINP
jgi:hypothetical protein